MAATATRIGGISGGRDETGVITVTQPWWVPTFAECFTVGEPELVVSGNVRIPQIRRDFGSWDRDLDPAGFQIGITYQGPDWSLDPKKVERFGFDSEYSEEPIETHPYIDILIKKYGGKLVATNDGEKRLVFSETVGESVGAGAGAGGMASAESGSDDRNPNFGIRSYPSYESVWTHTYLIRRLPNDFLERIGTVVKNPPGKPPTPKNRDWIIMVPSVEIFPNETGYRITDHYKLSKPGGWPPALTMLISK